jgi:hypothetical protein
MNESAITSAQFYEEWFQRPLAGCGGGFQSGGLFGMRRLVVVAAAVAAIAAGAMLASGRAEAMSLPGAGQLGAAAGTGLVQDVRYVCRPVWNGWRWVEQCFWVPGRHHHHHHHHHHHRRHHHHHHR